MSTLATNKMSTVLETSKFEYGLVSCQLGRDYILRECDSIQYGAYKFMNQNY